MSTGEHATELALRRQRLQMQSATLRQRAVAQLDDFAPALAVVDQARTVARWLREHPVVVVATLLGFALARPRRGLRWLSRVWFAWQLLPGKATAQGATRLATAALAAWRRLRG